MIKLGQGGLRMGTSRARKGIARSRGFTLVEVMIASALSIVVALGLASMMNRSNLQQKAIEQKDDFLEMQQLLKMSGATSTGCLAIFNTSGVDLSNDSYNINGTTTTSTDLTRINIPAQGGKILQPGNTALEYYTPGLKITKLTVERPGLALGGATYQLWLVIQASRKEGRKENDIATQLSARIPITAVDTNNNGNADSCVTGQTAGDKAVPYVVAANVAPADCVGNTEAHIQQCLNLAATGTPARSVLVKGVWNISNSMTVTAGTRVVGEPSTVLNLAAANTVAFNIATGNANPAPTSVEGVTIRLNPAGNSSGFNLSGDNITIKDNRFINDTGANNNSFGILVSGATYHLKIIDNIFGGWRAAAETDDTFNARGAIFFLVSAVMEDIVISGNLMKYVNMPQANDAVIKFRDQGNGGAMRKVYINNNHIGSTGTGGALSLDFNGSNQHITVFHVENNWFESTGGDDGIVELKGSNNMQLQNLLINGNTLINYTTFSSIYLSGFGHPATATGETNAVTNNFINDWRNTGNTAIVAGLPLKLISGNDIKNHQIGITLAGGASGPGVVQVTKNRMNGPNTGVLASVTALITNNTIENTGVGVNSRARDLVVTDNTILTEAALTGPSCGSVAAAGRPVGICVTGYRSNITGNHIKRLSGNGLGIVVNGSGGEAGSSIFQNNIMTDSSDAPLPSADACVGCNAFAKIITLPDGQEQRFGDAGIVLNERANIRVAGTGNVEVVNGGLNVGTGAPTVGKITVNGEAVPHGCRIGVGSTGSRTIAAGAMSNDVGVATCSAGETLFSCSCSAGADGLALQACMPGLGGLCGIIVKNITAAPIGATSTVMSMCCKQ